MRILAQVFKGFFIGRRSAISQMTSDGQAFPDKLCKFRLEIKLAIPHSLINIYLTL